MAWYQWLALFALFGVVGGYIAFKKGLIGGGAGGTKPGSKSGGGTQRRGGIIK